ncbi:response regulator [Methanoregula sp.]|jgi:DNA-binding NtrC family response regulator|uniref:response regulator n=1 Tax=Methanoregula sp. TaxID=2052170 RepID=UPI0035682BA8
MAVVRILIAAGDAVDADDLSCLAEAAGCRVEARASSGKEAVALAKKARHLDLVLIDTHRHGDMGSSAVVKKLQTLCNTPVVLVADSDEAVPILHRNAAVPYGCLVRPFGTRQFRQVIEAAVYRHSREPGLSGNGGGKKTYSDPAVRKIAHDINNSLSSALANIQLSRRSCPHKDRVLEHLDSAEASVLRARDHSHQLLTPSVRPKKEAGAKRGAKDLNESLQSARVQKEGVTTRYRILLMDDESAILSATSDMLSFMGHEVTVAENGDTALRLYTQAKTGAVPFDAVILDITVPGGKGAQETLPRLQALDSNVRAIVSSGYATHPLVVSFANSGFMAALVKPYGFKELEESLSQAFRS